MQVALMLKYWYTHAILAMKCSDLVTALAMSSQSGRFRVKVRVRVSAVMRGR